MLCDRSEAGFERARGREGLKVFGDGGGGVDEFVARSARLEFQGGKVVWEEVVSQGKEGGPQCFMFGVEDRDVGSVHLSRKVNGQVSRETFSSTIEHRQTQNTPCTRTRKHNPRPNPERQPADAAHTQHNPPMSPPSARPLPRPSP